MTVNTTLSGGAQPPSPRKSQGLLGLCRLRPVCLSVSKGEQYIAFPTDTRFQTLEPHIPDAFRHWNLLWMSGICSWLFAAEVENNQLRGIGGLVIRLYLGFYIPLRKELGSSKLEPYSSR